MPSAETVYLFRHALLRDAAYELQPPGERADLHGLAFDLIREIVGSPPEIPAPLDAPGYEYRPHPSDAFAQELSDHAEHSGKHAAERRVCLIRAAEHAEKHIDIDNAIALWKTVAQLETGAARAVALQRAAMTAARSGQPGPAEAFLNEALKHAEDSGNERVRGGVIARLAQVYDDTGRVELAEKGYEEALGIHHEVLDSTGGAMTLGNLASLYFQTGRHDLAEQTYKHVLELAGESGDLVQQGKSLGNLAGVYWATGRIELAETTIKRSLEIARETGDRRSEGIRIGNLASLQNGIGKREESLKNYALALEIQREVSDRRGVGITLGEVAWIEFGLGRLQEAARRYVEALEIHEQVHNLRYLAIHRCGYALCLLGLGERDGAQESFHAGTRGLNDIDDPHQYQRCIENMERVCSELGQEPLRPVARG